MDREFPDGIGFIGGLVANEGTEFRSEVLHDPVVKALPRRRLGSQN